LFFKQIPKPKPKPKPALLDLIGLPCLDHHLANANANTHAHTTQKPKPALLRLPSLTSLGANDGFLGVTVGWLEAKMAGGLIKLTTVDYGREALQEEVRP
jgi:hypothetical protein